MKTSHNYAIIWSDGYPSTFYKTIEDARSALEAVENDTPVTGRIVTIDEYLKA